MCAPDQKAAFEKAIIATVHRGMVEYDSAKQGPLGKIGVISAGRKGNFTDPETGKEYGFNLTIGDPNFFEENDNQDDEE